MKVNRIDKCELPKNCVYSSSDVNDQDFPTRSLMQLTIRCGKKKKKPQSHVLVVIPVPVFFCCFVLQSVLVYFPG